MLVRRSAAKPVPARQSASHGLGWIGIILLAAWLIHATGFAEPRPAEARPVLESLPELPGGMTIGTTRFGSGMLPPDEDAITQRIDEAAAAGLRGFTVYVNWPAIEPARGEFEFGPLLMQLDRLHARGLSTFVNITVGDIGEYVVPPEYAGDEGDLADGVRLDDPDLVIRFQTLLAALAPELLERGVFALGLGNEIDDRLDAAHPDEIGPYAAFVTAADSHLESFAPDLAVGVTLTAHAHVGATDTLAAMRDAADFVAVNYAPIDSRFFVLPEDEIAPALRALLGTFTDGPVVFQELSCPSAPSMNASDAWQARCFEILFEVLKRDRRVRFASVFTLEDFGQPLCGEIQALFPLEGVSPGFVERFHDYLCALGVLEPDGSAKPAWHALLAALATAPRGRREQLRERRSRPWSRRDILERGRSDESAGFPEP